MDSNRGPLELETIALPSEPQPLAEEVLFAKLFTNLFNVKFCFFTGSHSSTSTKGG